MPSSPPDAAAEEIAAAKRQAEDFLYMAAHDLKAPLTGIGGTCEILLADYGGALDAEGRRRLASLGELTIRLARRVDDLMALCRIDRQELRQTAVDLNAVVSDVLKILQPALERRGAAVRVQNPLPSATGNPTLLAVMLGNLIVNAVKFNDRPRPQVEIGALSADPPTLYVKDDGIGIAERHFAEIFTLFRRLHDGKQYEGSGAGLAIVRKILDVHGGRIWLDSTVGIGSTFYFTLPAADTLSRENESSEDTEKTSGRWNLPAPHWAEQVNVILKAIATS